MAQIIKTSGEVIEIEPGHAKRSGEHGVQCRYERVPTAYQIH